MTIQPQNSKLNYLIDPYYLTDCFFLSFARNAERDRRDSFSHFCVPSVKIKDFNALTDGKGFFHLPVKKGEEAYEKIIEMS